MQQRLLLGALMSCLIGPAQSAEQGEHAMPCFLGLTAVLGRHRFTPFIAGVSVGIRGLRPQLPVFVISDRLHMINIFRDNHFAPMARQHHTTSKCRASRQSNM